MKSFVSHVLYVKFNERDCEYVLRFSSIKQKDVWICSKQYFHNLNPTAIVKSKVNQN